MENKVLEEQLLINAMQEPTVTKQILAKNSSVLLTDEKDRNIAKLIIKYYNGTSTPLSEEVLRSHITKLISDENRKRTRQNADELTTDEENDYFTRAVGLYQANPNRSDEMLNDLDRYIHDKLTASTVLEASTYGEDGISNRLSEKLNNIAGLSIRGISNKPIDLFNDLDTREKIYKEEYIQNKVPFGIKPFDDLTRGGLKKGQLGLFAAPQGGGKTTILTNLSYYMALAGNNVLYYTLEELTSDSMLRFDRLISNASINDAMTEKGEIKPSFTEKVNGFLKGPGVQKHYPNHGLLSMLKGRPNEVTLDDVRQTLINTEQELGKSIDVMVLDYADLLKKSDNSLGHEAQSGERLFQDLVNLAQEQNIVLLTGAQLNRDNGNAEIKSLEQVEGAYRKKNVIAIGMTLNRNQQEYEEGRFRLYIDKLRNNYGNQEQFLYLKYQLKNMKLLAESPQEVEHHKGISGRDGSKNVEVKKTDKAQSMNDAITAGINESLAKAFS